MILFLDIGGSITRIAPGERTGEVSLEMFPTPPDFESGIEAIRAAGIRLIPGAPGVVIAGIAGHVENDVLVRAPNLPDWEGKDIAGALSLAFGAPAHVLNDAVLGGLGEAHKGAGVGAHILLYMALGTGIGASRIVDGKPDVTVGTETGHQSLVVSGTLIEAEDLVSGKALLKKYGKPAKEITDKAIWDECAKTFAPVLLNTILHFAPDLVVIGGSLVKGNSLSVEKVAEELAKIGGHLSSIPPIKEATLGDAAGLYGAQAYASQILP